MEQDLVIAGGGIGGLAAAIGAARAGWRAQVLERAETFAEVGAGLQFGPNVTRVLRQWPQAWAALQASAAAPGRLCVRDAASGKVLGSLRLGPEAATRYGAPYLTLHRADAHSALAVQARADGALLRTGERVHSFHGDGAGIEVRTDAGTVLSGAGLLGADGLWSRVREQLLGDGPPAFTGHLAYRSLLRQSDLPAAMRSQDVTVWLAPRMHAVSYPVRAGEELNVVCLAEGDPPADPRSWDGDAVVDGLRRAMEDTCPPLRDLVAAAPHWRLWALHARAPVREPAQMARGRVALVGDAAHPMLPYLAQGAGMAIEDAWTLQQVLRGAVLPQALHRYAQERWQRCGRVQARSARNARIFHAGGAVRGARDLAMRVLGEPLLDLPWLYRGP